MEHEKDNWPKANNDNTIVMLIATIAILVIERAALAPAAVVMPERMTTIPEGKTISYAAGYEDALDAVASLNRNTVPLELLARIPHEWNCGTLGGLRRAIDELHAILGANCGSIDDLTHDSEEPSHDR